MSDDAAFCCFVLVVVIPAVTIYFLYTIPFDWIFYHTASNWITVPLMVYYGLHLLFIVFSSILVFCGCRVIGKWFAIKKWHIPLVLIFYTLIPLAMSSVGLYMSISMHLNKGIFLNETLECHIMIANMYAVFFVSICRMSFGKDMNKRIKVPDPEDDAGDESESDQKSNLPHQQEPVETHNGDEIGQKPTCFSIFLMCFVDASTANKMYNSLPEFSRDTSNVDRRVFNV